jgi:hypothetical protein
VLLSRFWYVVTAIALGAAVFVLFIAVQLYNRSGQRAMGEALTADSSAVAWFLKDDVRNRSSALIPIALNPDIRAGLVKASAEDKPGREVRSKTAAALKKLADEVAEELKFDALWAVDAQGRVIANAGFEHTESWELGGYPVVADALHGWIRDDAWVWKGRIYRVVARPVEQEVNSEPVGAIVGAKIVDDAFARVVSKRTGAAVGFYADGARVASWAPEGFDKANLDQITRDLKDLDGNKDYQEKGRSEVRVLGEHLGVVYGRLPGEAWDLGAGFAVGRLAVAVGSPVDFFNKADDGDKKGVPSIYLLMGAIAIACAGLAFTFFEHTRPLSAFRAEVRKLAEGKIDTLQPSRFRGIYKEIAADLNDGVEKLVVKGGGSRRAADLEQVLGPIPAQPSMSAFSVPGSGGEGLTSSPTLPTRDGAGPKFPSAPGSKASLPEAPAKNKPMPPKPKPSAPASLPAEEVGELEELMAASEDPASAEPMDEIAHWRRVFEDFLALKKQCDEPTSSLTFEKFQGTLERNKAALVARHQCSRVKFTVYIKDGKAALKASPVK